LFRNHIDKSDSLFTISDFISVTISLFKNTVVYQK
jgi:hypothetical protein